MSLTGGSTSVVTPAMKGEPPSVCTPTEAPLEPWICTLPYSPGFCELLTTNLAQRRRS